MAEVYWRPRGEREEGSVFSLGCDVSNLFAGKCGKWILGRYVVAITTGDMIPRWDILSLEWICKTGLLMPTTYRIGKLKTHYSQKNASA